MRPVDDIRVLIIDNYDSYTYNLFQSVAAETSVLPVVIYNDEYERYRSLEQSFFDCVILSPGPGRPERTEDFGLCLNVIREWSLPILGVCLGFQGLVWNFGGRIEHAPSVCHGRVSSITHNGEDIFVGLPKIFSVVRYHSLCVDGSHIPDCLLPLAWSNTDNVLMACRHREKPIFGVQFHPESICTEYGSQILHNFLLIVNKEQNLSVFSARKMISEATIERPLKLSDCYSMKNEKLVAAWKRLRFLLNEVDCVAIFENVFEKSKTPSFWLDTSMVVDLSSSYSYMGDCSGPLAQYIEYNTKDQVTLVYKYTPGGTREYSNSYHCSIYDYLKSQLSQQRVENSDELPSDFCGGFVGYFGYETKCDCFPVVNRHQSAVPDAGFVFCDRFLVLDHGRNSIYGVVLEESSHGRMQCETQLWLDSIEANIENAIRFSKQQRWQTPGIEEVTPVFQWDISKAEYLRKIRSCLDFIYEGETYEVCLTNRISGNQKTDPLLLYSVLREVNPAPYSCFLNFNGFAICCSSPERFLRINEKKVIESKPIKGTIKRGARKEEDEALKEKLQTSEKDFAENLMIVDLVRNDFGKVCIPGKVWVPNLMKIESYTTVHQLVSTICGILRDDVSVVDAVRAAFPMGSMTGTPKLRTIEIIDSLESSARGIYSGSIGYLSLNQAVNLNVVIRSIVITDRGIQIGSGGAITNLSEEEEEYNETVLKVSALLKAISLSLGKGGSFQLISS
eukprot:jgi/Galph1/2503/GphlegSOOS_G1161.1